MAHREFLKWLFTIDALIDRKLIKSEVIHEKGN